MALASPADPLGLLIAVAAAVVLAAEAGAFLAAGAGAFLAARVGYASSRPAAALSSGQVTRTSSTTSPATAAPRYGHVTYSSTGP